MGSALLTEMQLNIEASPLSPLTLDALFCANAQLKISASVSSLPVLIFFNSLLNSESVIYDQICAASDLVDFI